MKWDVFGKKVERRLKRFPPDHPNRGEFCPDTFTVDIDVTLPIPERVQTEFHECIHAFLERMSITQTQISEDVQEIISNGLATWMLENKKVIEKRFKELDTAEAKAKAAKRTKSRKPSAQGA